MFGFLIFFTFSSGMLRNMSGIFVLSDNLTPKIDMPSLAFLRLGVIPLAFIV